jgi:asparagine synthetase B (glutamine-hydrolysing)
MLIWRGWGWHHKLRDENSLRENIFNSEYQRRLKKIDLNLVYQTALDRSPGSSFSLEHGSKMPSLFNKLLWLDLKNFVLPNKVAASDIASRLYSAAAYFPFLDNDLVEFCAQIPGEMKLKNESANGTKYILRQAVAELVGKENAFPGWKSGSDIPIAEWLLDSVVKKYIEDALKTSRIKKFGILNHEYISRILKEHYNNTELKFSNSAILGKKGIDHTHKISKLLCFQLWLENNFA